jgi:hypothetical protein
VGPCDPGRLHTANYDGSGLADLVNNAAGPRWSPDGEQIAFHGDPDGPPGNCTRCDSAVYVVKPDGSGETRITDPSLGAYALNWSPDSSKLVFNVRGDGGDVQVFVMNRDGTNVTQLTHGAVQNYEPVWSPDGTKIAFTTNRDGNAEIYSMNPDGTDQSNLTNNPSYDGQPSWQPLPRAYIRPRGATPFRASLVPAYQQCEIPNRTHGSPLGFGSCSPPRPTSYYLTVGTPDSNGTGANSQASVLFGVVPGNSATSADEADVGVVLSISDVRRYGDLTDYTGEVQLRVSELRITDKDNTPSYAGSRLATVKDTALSAAVTCTPTRSAAVGSDCKLHTTLDALYPGVVKEGQRSIWGFRQVKVYDGGSDGRVSTPSDNQQIFMDQGLFVP